MSDETQPPLSPSAPSTKPKLDLVKPRTAPGVLELLPHDQIAFQRFLDTIRQGYERFGFLPVETPVYELVDVLLTKSGGDTEKQVYFVQSTGARDQNKPAELALRFDLTVPLARYVAEHEQALAFPFRRYQIQRVYRGERAQKGRFREFYQADIDVIDRDTLALAYDAEMPAVIHHVFHELDVGRFTIHLNHRRLLKGLLLGQDVPLERHGTVLREIDKLDKVDRATVQRSLQGPECGLTDAAAGRMLDVLGEGGSNEEKLRRAEALATNDDARVGLAALRNVLEAMIALGVHAEHAQVDLSIARGLDYYTGTVYETRLVDHPGIGSVCSGGRYDDLASHYTKSRLPGVGISIGATRLFDQLREANLIAPSGGISQVFVAQLEASLTADCLALAAELRAAGINTELAAEPTKPAKQFKYADRIKARFVALLGGAEKAKGVVAIKHLATTEQREVPRAEVVAHLKQALAS